MRTIHLQDGQAGMFGYGSLLSVGSMESTLGYKFNSTPIICHLTGWRRTWDVVMPNRGFFEPTAEGEFVPENIIYLNASRSSGTLLNGLLYILDAAELQLFDTREWIYDRVDVTADSSDLKVEGGSIYLYVAKAQYLLDASKPRDWAALRSSYLALVEKGLNDLGEAFLAEYEQSTDPIPQQRIFQDVRRQGESPLAQSSHTGR
jgi:hypothetical protein